MYTPEEIRNIEFTKTLGGYKTSEVDPFIDNCADTVEALMREKDELTKKLEVLADKLVEYRNEEDSIRTALLSAQRLGDTVVREANHKASLILEDANIKAEKISENARKSIQQEEEELRRIQKEVADFKKALLSMYRKHLAVIDALPEEEEEAQEPVPAAAPSPQPAVEAAPLPIEPPVQAQPIPAAPPAAPAAEPIPAAPVAEAPTFSMNLPTIDDDVQVETVKPQEVPPAAPASQPNPRFANLKFGDEYDISADTEEVAGGFFKRKK